MSGWAPFGFHTPNGNSSPTRKPAMLLGPSSFCQGRQGSADLSFFLWWIWSYHIHFLPYEMPWSNIYIYHITVDTIWYDNIWYMKYNNLMEVENSCIWKVPTIEGTHFSLPWFWEEGYTYTLTKFDQFSKKKQEIKQKIRRQCFPTKGFQVLIQQTFHWKIGITNHQK